MHRLVLASLLALAPVNAACSGDSSSGDTDGPKLIVLVAVDQLRGDLVMRYDDLFTGGLRRLLDQSASFVNTTHDHAETATAPGHATLATGVHPARHGIAGNSWSEQRDGEWASVYAVEDLASPILADSSMPGRSPANLFRDGLADWVRAADPNAEVVSISRKDRTAVTLGGRSPGHVYWLALGRGVDGFTTSSFYADSLPTWVQEANAGLAPVLWGDTVWASVVPEAARDRARPDALATEGDGVNTTMPHRAWVEADMPDRRDWGGWLEGTPATDAAVLRLAEAALEALSLGQRGSVDYLAVGLSATDAVGHGYGPLSQEQLDNLLRLDRELGVFLETLDRVVGEGNWVLGLSADHGALDMVEWRIEQGLFGYRMTLSDDRAMRQLAEETGGDAAAFAEALETLDIVADAITLDELRAGEPADSLTVLFRNSHVDGRVTGPIPDIDVVVRYQEGVYGSRRGTGHGAPYHYDRWVPFMLMGPGVPAGIVDARAATVDVAPTLAAIAGIPVPDDLDGTPRVSAPTGSGR